MREGEKRLNWCAWRRSRDQARVAARRGAGHVAAEEEEEEEGIAGWAGDETRGEETARHGLRPQLAGLVASSGGLAAWPLWCACGEELDAFG